MAREYPRFLFSNPQNTKSKGPFIVHLLDPLCIFKIIVDGAALSSSRAFVFKLLKSCEPIDDQSLQKIKQDAFFWLMKQIEQNEISI